MQSREPTREGLAAIASWCGLGADECGYGDDRCHVHLLQDERDRLRLAVRSIDEPYPVEVFPDLREREAVFAAMREVNRYATEQFHAEVARQRGKAARTYLQDGDLG